MSNQNEAINSSLNAVFVPTNKSENDKLVLGHGHMYGELIPSCLIKFLRFLGRTAISTPAVSLLILVVVLERLVLVNKCVFLLFIYLNLFIFLGCLYGIQEQSPRKYRN